MPLFPWNFNKFSRNQNNAFFPNGENFQYNNFNGGYIPTGVNNFQNYCNGNIYSEPINSKSAEIIKRNIEAEKEKFAISKKREFKLSEKTKLLIQNEKNSFLFYEYLRGICNKDTNRKILKKISDDCLFAQNVYSDFYKRFSGEDYTPTKSNVNENIDFYNGILWAIDEESNSIFSTSDFIEEFEFYEHEKITIVLIRKNARIGYLCYILQTCKKN